MHRFFPVEEVREFDVVDEAIVVDVAVVEQLSQLFVANRNVKLKTCLVQIFPRYQSFLVLNSPSPDSLNKAID